MTIDDARNLMHEWIKNPALRVHMETVAACCAKYAENLAPDKIDKWTVVGLLHDFDYEKHPTLEEHPYVGVEHLRQSGVEEGILQAILGHANHTGVARETLMAKTLFAVDELAGFIVACAKVRPNGISDLSVNSVKKKLKDKRFAAAVNRDEIEEGIKDLEVVRDKHIGLCIEAIKACADRLEL